MVNRRKTEIVGEETWAGAGDNCVLHRSQPLFPENSNVSSSPSKPRLSFNWI